MTKKNYKKKVKSFQNQGVGITGTQVDAFYRKVMEHKPVYGIRANRIFLPEIKPPFGWQSLPKQNF
jgi:hypothetical protein